MASQGGMAILVRRLAYQIILSTVLTYTLTGADQALCLTIIYLFFFFLSTVGIQPYGVCTTHCAGPLISRLEAC